MISRVLSFRPSAAAAAADEELNSIPLLRPRRPRRPRPLLFELISLALALALLLLAVVLVLLNLLNKLPLK